MLLVNIIYTGKQQSFLTGRYNIRILTAGTVAWIHGQSAEIFHAGDTVAYLIRDGGLVRQLTRLHEENGAIYRYFGLGAYLEIDMVIVQPFPDA
ncbi:MAG: hypothetical protein WCR46_22175 [Deltaproteobacteria bacterium]